MAFDFETEALRSHMDQFFPVEVAGHNLADGHLLAVDPLHKMRDQR